MSIFQEYFAPIFAGFLVFLTQFIVYFVYKKSKSKIVAMYPNIALLVVGLLVVLVTYIVASNTDGTWAGLAAIIMLMLVIFATFASSLTSILLIYILSRRQ
jgi:tellurite resistance protein TehA-like permease